MRIAGIAVWRQLRDRARGRQVLSRPALQPRQSWVQVAARLRPALAARANNFGPMDEAQPFCAGASERDRRHRPSRLGDRAGDR
eukprot:976444-Pleurochrysis_carterae.AAC.1